jgi:hypothetical protein
MRDPFPVHSTKVGAVVVRLRFCAGVWIIRRPSLSYSGVMLVAKERPNLLPLVEAALRVGRDGDQFSGAAVFAAAPGLTSNLLPLSRRGVVEKTGRTPDDRAFYRLVDPPGVERALRELGRL